MQIIQRSPITAKLKKWLYPNWHKILKRINTDELPTMRMWTVKLPTHGLPLDAQARPYLEISESGDTLEIVEKACKLFRKRTGSWPTEINLSYDRYALCGERMRGYSPEYGVIILYRYGGRKDYDVLVR